MNMPLDWPRINQFPEWFTVQAKKSYTLHDLSADSTVEYTGKQLSEGILITLQPGSERLLMVQ